jgi:hypothetical protein
MSPDDRWRIAHMIEAAEQALAFVVGRQRADLDTDVMLRLALARAVDAGADGFLVMLTRLSRPPHWRQRPGPKASDADRRDHFARLPAGATVS